MPACTIFARKAWSRLPPTITRERVMRTFDHLASASPQTRAWHPGGAGPARPQGKKISKNALVVELLEQSLAANGQLVSSVQRRPLIGGSPESTPPKGLAWHTRGAHRRYSWSAGEVIAKCAVVIGKAERHEGPMYRTCRGMSRLESTVQRENALSGGPWPCTMKACTPLACPCPSRPRTGHGSRRRSQRESGGPPCDHQGGRS
jgi:hypothetical protein